MNRIIFLFPVFVLLVLASPAVAQQHVKPHPPPVRVPKPPPPPHVNPYKKKDTVKKGPYQIDTLIRPIPIGRVYWHDKIDNEQQKADLADRRADSVIHVGKDSLATAILTTAILRKVDTLQIMIENMPDKAREPAMDNAQKIRCLRAVWELLRQYNGDPKPSAEFYSALVANMHKMIIASNEEKMMEFAVANTNMYTLENSAQMMDNHPEVRAYVYTQIGKANPLMMIKRLPEFAKDTFAGRIIAAAAHVAPDLIFTYAYSTNYTIRNAVGNTADPFVQAIVKVATQSKAPLKAFPFLGDVYAGRKTIAEIDTITAHSELYFQNLVRLKLDDDSIGKKAYLNELEYRALGYVRQMNDLHEEKDPVRFKCIDSLPASSLYFIMVYGQNEI